jgi:hypothetical protein
MKLVHAFTILTFLSFLFACNNVQNKQEPQIGYASKESIPPYINRIIEKFCLPYDDSIGVKNNNLIFYYSKNFDTSYLVHLQKNDSIINGVYYEILPAFHRSDADYTDKKSKLLFFNGYSFEIDSNKWSMIINKARNKLLSEQYIPPQNEACLDCASYFILNDYKMNGDNNGNRHLFAEYAKFLKDSLLNGFIAKRQPKLPFSQSR